MQFYSKLKYLIRSIALKMPLKNIILFESRPDFCDNARYVYDYFLNRGLDKNYKLIWISYDNKRVPKGIKAITANSIICRWLFLRAKAIISCNRIIGSSSMGQFSIYLDHGTPLKDVTGIMVLPTNLSCYLSSSESSLPLRSKILQISPNTDIICLGFPRNDVFSNHSIDISDFFPNKYNKIIVWYPTFRQQVNSGRVDAGEPMPIVHNQIWAIQLNETLKENNSLIVLKPHFAQDTSFIRELGLSNIMIIDDSFFNNHNISSYDFLNSCDALITDYSSVYYDFLLTDKPIGLIWEDIEKYKKNPGLVENYDFLCQGAEKIYNIEDYCTFVENLANGVDLLKNERHTICQWAHYSSDGMNSKRVGDYIISRL